MYCMYSKCPKSRSKPQVQHMFWMGAREMFWTLKCSTVSDKMSLYLRHLLGHTDPAITTTNTLTSSGPALPIKQVSDDNTFNVLHLHANGIGNKLMELGVVLDRHNVKVVVIQRSKLSPKSKNPCIRNYTTVRKDRPHGH